MTHKNPKTDLGELCVSAGSILVLEFGCHGNKELNCISNRAQGRFKAISVSMD